MINRILGTLAAASVATPAAFAGGFYANVEANSSLTGTNYTNTTTDIHIGYEGGTDTFGYYVQGGPAFSAADGVDGNTDFSGKLGGTIAASEKFDVYGEISFITDEVTDTAYGTKIGPKYKI